MSQIVGVLFLTVMTSFTSAEQKAPPRASEVYNSGFGLASRAPKRHFAGTDAAIESAFRPRVLRAVLNAQNDLKLRAPYTRGHWKIYALGELDSRGFHDVRVSTDAPEIVRSTVLRWLNGVDYRLSAGKHHPVKIPICFAVDERDARNCR